MRNVVIEDPIINSPFEEPRRHFRFDEEGITDEIVEERRASSYFMPIPQAKKKARAGSSSNSRPSGRRTGSSRTSSPTTFALASACGARAATLGSRGHSEARESESRGFHAGHLRRPAANRGHADSGMDACSLLVTRGFRQRSVAVFPALGCRADQGGEGLLPCTPTQYRPGSQGAGEWRNRIGRMGGRTAFIDSMEPRRATLEFNSEVLDFRTASESCASTPRSFHIGIRKMEKSKVKQEIAVPLEEA